jgi:hypothetical protein
MIDRAPKQRDSSKALYMSGPLVRRFIPRRRPLTEESPDGTRLPFHQSSATRWLSPGRNLAAAALYEAKFSSTRWPRGNVRTNQAKVSPKPACPAPRSTRSRVALRHERHLRFRSAKAVGANISEALFNSKR